MQRTPCRASRRCVIALAAAASLLATAVGAAADDGDAPSLSLLLPSDRGLRADIAWLVDRGVLALPLGVWPLASSTLRAAWSGVSPERLGPADADALARVKRAVQRSTATLRIVGGVNSARHPALDGSATAQGFAAGSINAYAGAANWGGQLTLQATGDALTPDAPQGSLAGSYAAFQSDNTVFAGGAVDRWWGPGQFTSPILATAAQPIAGAFVRRVDDRASESKWLSWLGRWGYEISAGRLVHYTPSGTRTIGLRVYTKPWPNVELGLSRSILWAGEGRPHDWVALRDALLGRSNVDGEANKDDDPSDEIAGFDLRVSAVDDRRGIWVGYLHLVGEDEAGSMASKLFGTVGVQYKTIVDRARLEFTFEATDTMPRHVFGLREAAPPPAYQHAVYEQGYYQGQLALGAAIGGGGEIFTLGAAWTPIDDPRQLRVGAALFGGRMSAMGAQPRNAAWGVEGRLAGMSLDISGETAGGLKWQLGLSVQHYPAGGRPTAGVRAGVEMPVYGLR